MSAPSSPHSMQRRPLAFVLIAVLLGALLWFAWGVGERGAGDDLAPAQGAAPSPAAVAEEPLDEHELVVPAAPPARELLHAEQVLEDVDPKASSALNGAPAVRLLGRILREDHSPLAGAGVWLMARAEPPGIERRVFEEKENRRVLAQTRTDGSGHFELPDIAPGQYWIGPAPGSEDEGSPAWLPLAVQVEILEHGGEELVEILLPSALHVSGHVLDADGEPAEGIVILASSPHIYGLDSGETSSTGHFRLGPFPPGECQVMAFAMGVVVSGPETVPAGTEDLLIRLGTTGRVSGRLVDGATGELRRGTLSYSRGPSSFGSSASPAGTFELTLPSGAYALTATGSDSRIAVLFPVVVGPNAQVDGLELRLLQGGRVRVRHQGEAPWARLIIRWDGHRVAHDSLRPGTESLQTVPPGEVDVELQIGGEPVDSRRVTVAAGELVEVLFQR